MNKITPDELKRILERHIDWFTGRDGGQCADLHEAGLKGADLSNAFLYMADLSDADLQGAAFGGAHLTNANFNGANLREADLSWAYLHGANLSGADLRGATLPTLINNVILYGAQTDKTYYQVAFTGCNRNIITYCVDDDHISYGPWEFYNDSLERFKARVAEVYPEGHQHRIKYDAVIAFFEAMKNKEGKE
jgi:hypothetical protein